MREDPSLDPRAMEFRPSRRAAAVAAENLCALQKKQSNTEHTSYLIPIRECENL